MPRDSLNTSVTVRANVFQQDKPQSIFDTALSEETDETRGLELGAIDYIKKPYKPAIVEARVRNHLDLIRHRTDLEKKLDTITQERVASTQEYERLYHQENETGLV